MITSFPALYRREDSRSLVANIRANPDDDTARLAYADWLEEMAMAGEDAAFESHYLARVQFVRAGCCNPGKSLTRLNRAESKWLADERNIARLMPTLMAVQSYHDACHHLSEDEGIPFFLEPLRWRKGRECRFEIEYRTPRIHPRDYAGYFTAHLRRGFIDAIDWHWNLPYWTRLMPAIARDDPFVCCRFPETAGPAVRHQDGTWARRVYANEVGGEVFKLLKPTLFVGGSIPGHASYMDVELLKATQMATHDLNRASREWAEAAPITVSMTDAEFFGSGRYSLADALSV